jgi:hypothetical protein
MVPPADLRRRDRRSDRAGGSPASPGARLAGSLFGNRRPDAPECLTSYRVPERSALGCASRSTCADRARGTAPLSPAGRTVVRVNEGDDHRLAEQPVGGPLGATDRACRRHVGPTSAAHICHCQRRAPTPRDVAGRASGGRASLRPGEPTEVTVDRLASAGGSRSRMAFSSALARIPPSL